MEDYLGPGDIQIIVEAGAMEETNMKPPRKPKGEKQVGQRAKKVPVATAEREFGGLKQGFKQADRVTYCLKDYKGAQEPLRLMFYNPTQTHSYPITDHTTKMMLDFICPGFPSHGICTQDQPSSSGCISTSSIPQ